MSDTAAPSPKVPGLEPTFRHLDDPTRNGRKFDRFSGRRNQGVDLGEMVRLLAGPAISVALCQVDPGIIIRRHGHYSPHVVFVISGDMTCGGRYCPAGTHIELPFGAAFGPFVAVLKARCCSR